MSQKADGKGNGRKNVPNGPFSMGKKFPNGGGSRKGGFD
jgi:hypothetical protein